MPHSKVDPALARVRDDVLYALAGSLERADHDVDLMGAVALDCLARIDECAATLRAAISERDVRTAALAGAQLAALGRMIEVRMLCAVERRVATQTAVGAAAYALPQQRSARRRR